MGFLKTMSLSSRVLLGLGLGVLLGLFIGEWASPLGVLGDAFILLLQMPVLPYVALSLTASLGRLDYRVAGQLARKGGALLGVLWALSLLMVGLYPLSFPRWESAAFFSSSLVTAPQKISFLGMYIPANIFKSLAENMVPAVVLFSVVFGVTLIGMKEKEQLLDQLDVGVKALGSISRNVANLAPYGVFAIAAEATGTLSFADFGRLQVYVITYLAVSLVMALWVMPGLVSSLTPLSYRQVVGPVRDVLVTAFATGNLFIVLPMLAEKSHEIVAKCTDSDKSRKLVDVIVPTSFNFPNVGKLMTLTFVPYAGWFTGHLVQAGQVPSFLLSGLFTFFGSIPVAIPFLLEQLRIPSDMFQIYLVLNNLVNVRVGTLMSAMHIIVLAVLGAYVILGRPLQWKGLVRYGVICLALTLAAIGGTRLLIETALPHDYTLDDAFEGMAFTREYAPVRVMTDVAEALPPVTAGSRTDAIRARGFLRVGFFADALPFAYKNTAGDVVGYDAEMARMLARDLGVDLELVKLERGTLQDALDTGVCDLIMSGLVITVERLMKAEFTQPYMDQTVAFLVQDHRATDFSSAARLAQMDSLRIGVQDEPFIRNMVKKLVPNARIEIMDSPRPFLRGQRPDLDAVLNSAEAGSAWSLIYSSYSVAVPMPRIIQAPTAYPVALKDKAFADFVSGWIELKEREGELDRLFHHWIEGEGTQVSEPRWCIARNVLGWGE